MREVRGDSKLKLPLFAYNRSTGVWIDPHC